MKCFLCFTQTLAFILILAASSFAQTQTAQTVTTQKIVYVNSEAFYDKEKGITELVEIDEKLRAEFKLEYDELTVLGNRLMTLQAELEEDNKFYKFVKVSPEFIKITEEKIAEYESLIEKYKTKEAVAKYLYERRAAETIDVVKKKIARLANSFAAENGFVLILDISKSDGTFTFSSFDNADVTIDFIKYCNENFAQTQIQ